MTMEIMYDGSLTGVPYLRRSDVRYVSRYLFQPDKIIAMEHTEFTMKNTKKVYTSTSIDTQ